MRCTNSGIADISMLLSFGRSSWTQKYPFNSRECTSRVVPVVHSISVNTDDFTLCCALDTLPFSH